MFFFLLSLELYVVLKQSRNFAVKNRHILFLNKAFQTQSFYVLNKLSTNLIKNFIKLSNFHVYITFKVTFKSRFLFEPIWKFWMSHFRDRTRCLLFIDIPMSNPQAYALCVDSSENFSTTSFFPPMSFSSSQFWDFMHSHTPIIYCLSSKSSKRHLWWFLPACIFMSLPCPLVLREDMLSSTTPSVFPREASNDMS